MNKELAIRTIGYLIGYYRTHDETTINSQEIEAIEYLYNENTNLKQALNEIRNYAKTEMYTYGIKNNREQSEHILQIIDKVLGEEENGR